MISYDSPTERDGARILKRVVLECPVESKTRHRLPTDEDPRFVALEIAKYKREGEFYLFHITNLGDNNDTCHASLNEAMKQAEFEFGVKESDWVDVATNCDWATAPANLTNFEQRSLKERLREVFAKAESDNPE